MKKQILSEELIRMQRLAEQVLKLVTKKSTPQIDRMKNLANVKKQN